MIKKKINKLSKNVQKFFKFNDFLLNNNNNNKQ